MEFQNYSVPSTDWMSFLFLGMAFCFGILHFFGFFSIRELWKGLLTSDSRTEKTNTVVNTLLNLNSIAVAALLLQKGLSILQNSQDLSGMSFLRIFLVILVIVAFQRLVIYLHAGMTKTGDFFNDYLSFQNGIAHLAALMALPLLIISVYSEYYSTALFFMSASVFGGIYLFGVVKAIALSNKLKGSLKFHLIFYLCGNEILPYFLFYKILI